MYRCFVKKVAVLSTAVFLISLSSCTSLPKLSSLEPIPAYPEDRGGWDTSSRCVVFSDNSIAPTQRILTAIGDAGYSTCGPPAGYITREVRLSVDKALRIDSYSSAQRVFQDGSATESSIVVTVHDTKHLTQYGPFSAQARSITQKVNLQKIPGGKELLKQIKEDPSKVDRVPELLGKDPLKVTAFVQDKNVYVSDEDVTEILMRNLLSQPEFRGALAIEL